MLRSLVRGFGILPLSTRPIRRSRLSSQPPEDLLSPRVEEAEGQDHDEDRHLDEAEPLIGVDPGGERADEHGLDVAHHEEQCVDVVPNLALTPTGAHGIDAGLVVDVLARSEEHTSEIPLLLRISSADFLCKKTPKPN